MLTRTLRIMLNVGGLTDQSQELALVADGAEDRSIVVPGPTEAPNDLAAALALAKDQLVMLYMVADGAAVVKTNDKITPADTFTLAANVPVLWFSASGLANPFSVDVTSIFLTTDSTEDVTVDIRILVDATE